ncbi:MAG: GntR family transcriptional regulator [Capsulimonadaceae bacterium]|nr:GntR family transcriptional regulator [Capsulimonadaceae bacterium]
MASVNNIKGAKTSAPARIAEKLRADLLDAGDLVPGDRLPAVRELEERYGYSRMSLASALSLLEQEGRIERRHGVGIFMAERQAHTAFLGSGVVGLIVSDVMPFPSVSMFIYSGVEEECRTQDRHVVVASATTVAEEERELDRLVASGCRTIVMNPVIRTREEMDTDYLKRKYLDIPVVLVDMAYPEQGRTQVVFDNYQAGYDMTTLLLERGHRRIAFMLYASTRGTLMHFSNGERHRGYLAAMKHAGVPPICWTFDNQAPDDIVMRDIKAHLRDEAASGNGPTAVIALHAAWANTTIALLRELGMRPQEDIFVVGFDDPKGCSFPTTGADFRQAGKLAARLALQQQAEHAVLSRIFVLPVPIENTTLRDESRGRSIGLVSTFQQS